MKNSEVTEELKKLSQDKEIVVLADGGYIKSTIFEIIEKDNKIYFNIDINDELKELIE
jgi:TusA-related sulfurtransferase